MNVKKNFFFLFFLILFLKNFVISLDYETAKNYFENKNYESAYDAYNKCTSGCLETGNCNEEHFLCMMEIGRMLEQGLAENDLTREQRYKKAKFWYKYCSDKRSEICAEKLSTLNPKTQFIVKNIQEKLFDLDYPITRDDIPGAETFKAIKNFQEKQGLPIELPTEPEEWLKLNDILASAVINKKNYQNLNNLGKPSDYATGVWIGKKNKLYVLTAGHFANGCNKIRSGKLGLRIYQVDNENDLALLESNDIKNDNYIPAKFPSGGIYENEKIYVYGYPRQTILGKSETSEGEIISLKSSGGDRSKIVISGNLHLHSSGSPVINERGLIIGIVHAKSSIWKQIKEKFNLNVTSVGHNLAISTYAIRSFLDEHNIKYFTVNPKKKDREEILSKAKNYTIALECWGTKK